MDIGVQCALKCLDILEARKNYVSDTTTDIDGDTSEGYSPESDCELESELSSGAAVAMSSLNINSSNNINNHESELQPGYVKCQFYSNVFKDRGLYIHLNKCRNNKN